MSDKQRADVALVERGLCESRAKAQASIMAGEVFVGLRRINKASEIIKPEDELTLKGSTGKFLLWCAALFFANGLYGILMNLQHKESLCYG